MNDGESAQPQYYCWKEDQLYVDVLVQADASHDQIVGVHDNRLKVHLATSPVAGKANEHLMRFMAEYFGVPYSHVHLTKGSKSRMKQICINKPLNNLP